MPAGLDGNPNPIVTPAREAVLATTVDLVVAASSRSPRTLVAIDGRPGSGKSTFADELAWRLDACDVRALRSTTDSFHRPRGERMRLGPQSSEGYYRDSHQLDVIVGELLRPFSQGEPEVLVAAFDEPSDRPRREVASAGEPAVLLFDGLFVQRPELQHFWDHTIYLDADRRLDDRWLGFLFDELPEDATARAAEIDHRLHRARWPRYRDGWSHYVESVQPATKASLVIDNNDLANPQLIGRRP